MEKKTTYMIAGAVLAAVLAVAIVIPIQGAEDRNQSANAKIAGQFSNQGNQIMVTVYSPFGVETISSFQIIHMSNLMGSQRYSIQLEGPVMNDKWTLLNWVQNDMHRLKSTDVPSGTMLFGTGKVAATEMAQPKAGDPPTAGVEGKVTVQITQGMTFQPTAANVLRQYDFGGCYIGGYKIATFHDPDKPFNDQSTPGYAETVLFVCSSLYDVHPQNINGAIETNPKIMNEKGELIIKSSEKYRSPIVIEDQNQLRLETKSKQVKPDIVTRTELDKASYKIGDKATFTVTFTDLQGDNIDPDKIKAYYDGQAVQLEKQNVGVYTFTTSGLAKTNHQLIVSAEKTGFPTETTYLSMPIQHIS